MNLWKLTNWISENARNNEINVYGAGVCTCVFYFPVFFAIDTLAFDVDKKVNSIFHFLTKLEWNNFLCCFFKVDRMSKGKGVTGVIFHLFLNFML